MSLFEYNPTQAIEYDELTKKLSTKTRGGEINTELAKTFYIFQLNPNNSDAPIQSLHKTKPVFEGTEEAPDMLLQIKMLCFNLADSEKVDSRTRATMRMVVQQQEAVDKNIEPLVWVASAGLKLYDATKKKKSDPKELSMDFIESFGQRPIEVPKGKAQITFDVYKHNEPKWWKKIFRFLLSSEKGKLLTSAMGFPAITLEAMGIVDELLSKLNKSKTETLFKSAPLKLVMHNTAKQDVEAGGLIRAGVLNPGLYVLCQGGDLKFFKDTPATYYDMYGKLIPKEVKEDEFLAPEYKNPFENKTYAIFNMGMQPTKLKANLIFEMPVFQVPDIVNT